MSSGGSTPTPKGERHAADWQQIWADGVPAGTRFDISTAHKLLLSRIASGTVPNGPALVPGCGRAYDLAALASPDRHVTGVDIAPTAVEEARKFLQAAVPEKADYYTVKEADFFGLEEERGKMAFIFDYTFLCALPPSLRGEWAKQMAALLRPGGELFCLQFPLGAYGDTHKVSLQNGPPFILSKQLYHDLLTPLGLVCVEEGDIPAEMSDPKRAGLEAFSRWRKD